MGFSKTTIYLVLKCVENNMQLKRKVEVDGKPTKCPTIK